MNIKNWLDKNAMDEEVEKYKKKKQSNISKSKYKSKHKHEYESCLIRYTYKLYDKEFYLYRLHRIVGYAGRLAEILILKEA